MTQDSKFPNVLYAHWTQERLSHIALTEVSEGESSARYVNADAMIEMLEAINTRTIPRTDKIIANGVYDEEYENNTGPFCVGREPRAEELEYNEKYPP